MGALWHKAAAMSTGRDQGGSTAILGVSVGVKIASFWLGVTQSTQWLCEVLILHCLPSLNNGHFQTLQNRRFCSQKNDVITEIRH